MAQTEHRKAERRKGPVRAKMERRTLGLAEGDSTRTGKDRRGKERRTGNDRRKAKK